MWFWPHSHSCPSHCSTGFSVGPTRVPPRALGIPASESSMSCSVRFGMLSFSQTGSAVSPRHLLGCWEPGILCLQGLILGGPLALSHSCMPVLLSPPEWPGLEDPVLVHILLSSFHTRVPLGTLFLLSHIHASPWRTIAMPESWWLGPSPTMTLTRAVILSLDPGSASENFTASSQI